MVCWVSLIHFLLIRSLARACSKFTPLTFCCSREQLGDPSWVLRWDGPPHRNRFANRLIPTPSGHFWVGSDRSRQLPWGVRRQFGRWLPPLGASSHCKGHFVRDTAAWEGCFISDQAINRSLDLLAGPKSQDWPGGAQPDEVFVVGHRPPWYTHEKVESPWDPLHRDLT